MLAFCDEFENEKIVGKVQRSMQVAATKWCNDKNNSFCQGGMQGKIKI